MRAGGCFYIMAPALLYLHLRCTTCLRYLLNYHATVQLQERCSFHKSEALLIAITRIRNENTENMRIRA